MLIYLDTSDLINILECSRPISLLDFSERLEAASAELVLSFVVVAELAAPLLHRSSRTNVMQLLTDLESLPHRFIADGQILRRELEAALRAFSESLEYRPIDPFVPRFDYTVPADGPPATEVYLEYSISEIVWDLWNEAPEIFEGYGEHHGRFETLMSDDRSMEELPSLAEHFPETLRRDCVLHRVEEPADLESFGSWLYSNPSRCPAKRLIFEIWHRLRANVTDGLRASDLSDVNHLICLPYVNLATLDRRMLSYVRQIDFEMGLAECHANVTDVLSAIGVHRDE